jgi:hypothetical protein
MGTSPGAVKVLIWAGSAVPGARVGAGERAGPVPGALEQLRMRIVKIIRMSRGIACLGIWIITLIIIRIIRREVPNFRV